VSDQRNFLARDMTRRSGARAIERRTSERRTKWGVTLAAFVVVTAQLLALAHSHSGPGPTSYDRLPQTAATDYICGLCILVFHAPLSLAEQPPPERPRVEELATRSLESSVFVLDSPSPFLTRGPPTQRWGQNGKKTF
jgi:hypothetical protein